MKMRDSRPPKLLTLLGLALGVIISSVPIARAADSGEPFMVEQQPGDANSFTRETSQQPRNWQIDQWSGARHRRKRFLNPDFNQFGSDPRPQRQNNNFDNQDAASIDPSLRKPDKFADQPQTDAAGVRHFSNGKHFDLNKVSLDQALSEAQPPNPSAARFGDIKNQFSNGIANSSLPPRGGYWPRNQYGPPANDQSEFSYLEPPRRIRRQQENRRFYRPDSDYVRNW